jgi:hypothetical protein
MASGLDQITLTRAAKEVLDLAAVRAHQAWVQRTGRLWRRVAGPAAARPGGNP